MFIHNSDVGLRHEKIKILIISEILYSYLTQPTNLRQVTAVMKEWVSNPTY